MQVSVGFSLLRLQQAPLHPMSRASRDNSSIASSSSSSSSSSVEEQCCRCGRTRWGLGGWHRRSSRRMQRRRDVYNAKDGSNAPDRAMIDLLPAQLSAAPRTRLQFSSPGPGRGSLRKELDIDSFGDVGDGDVSPSGRSVKPLVSATHMAAACSPASAVVSTDSIALRRCLKPDAKFGMAVSLAAWYCSRVMPVKIFHPWQDCQMSLRLPNTLGSLPFFSIIVTRQLYHPSGQPPHTASMPSNRQGKHLVPSPSTIAAVRRVGPWWNSVSA